MAALRMRAALHELYGLGWDYSRRLAEHYAKVTPAEVRRVARKYLAGPPPLPKVGSLPGDADGDPLDANSITVNVTLGVGTSLELTKAANKREVTIGGVVLWESPITALSDVDWSVTQIEATLSMQGSATTANMMGRILIGSQATWPSTGQGAMANLSLDAMIGADDTTVTGFDAGTKDFEIDWKWDVADPDASFKAETGYVARL